MVSMTTMIGLLAAFCTTVSYIPQVRKIWQTGRTGDLSLKTFSLLAAGIALWVVYGVLQQDPVIVLANAITLLLLANILYFKLREAWSGRS
jgi:MtN3 and saliva related transmembrane protein